jgi:hypothetical protein
MRAREITPFQESLHSGPQKPWNGVFFGSKTGPREALGSSQSIRTEALEYPGNQAVNHVWQGQGLFPNNIRHLQRTLMIPGT